MNPMMSLTRLPSRRCPIHWRTCLFVQQCWVEEHSPGMGRDRSAPLKYKHYAHLYHRYPSTAWECRHQTCCYLEIIQKDSLVRDCGISSVSTMEITQPCIGLSWQSSSRCCCPYFYLNMGACESQTGGRLNKKDGLTRYGDSHVKDKTS